MPLLEATDSGGYAYLRLANAHNGMTVHCLTALLKSLTYTRVRFVPDYCKIGLVLDGLQNT